jgi:uncharacterized protein GlcG (DUF336 family)
MNMLARALIVCTAFAAYAATAQDGTYTVRLMTLETAMEAAQAALNACRKSGYQVSVAVVDRSGVAHAVLRDRFAGAHTVEMALDKGWTAVSFRVSTGALAEATLPGKPQSGIRERPRVVVVAGGLSIEGAGALLGGIGVSGAPGGGADELCVRAGIAAIQAKIDF